MENSFVYKNNSFNNLFDLLCHIDINDVKALYDLFNQGDPAFCSFLKKEVPAIYADFFGRNRGEEMFFWKLCSFYLQKHPDNQTLIDLKKALKKEYEHNLAHPKRSKEFDVMSSFEKKYIDIEFGNEKTAVTKAVKFGSYHYYEDGTLDSILWYVLSENDEKMLLVSCYGVDVMPFNENNANNDFSTSSLAKWLKTDFYNTAFNTEEKRQVDVMPFILDDEQAAKYFTSNSERLLKPTPYAAKKGIPLFNNGSTWWWLATPGSMGNCAAYVNYNGKIKKYGEFVFIKSIAVRPAIVINKKHGNIKN